MSVWAFGNPLLDLVVEADLETVKRFNLEANVGQEADTEAIGLLDEALKRRPILSVGGCALNTCRVLKWIEAENEVAFFGTVGNDENAKSLRKLIKQGKD